MDVRGWTLRDMETMDAAIDAFASGEGDAIFGWKAGELVTTPPAPALLLDTIDQLEKLEVDANVVWESIPVPYGPHAIRSGLSEEAKQLILPFLTALNDNNPEAYEAIETRYTGGFQPVEFEDYRPVVDALRKPLLFSGASAQDN